MSNVFVGEAIPFTAGFKASGLGAVGLTVTVDVRRNGTEIVTAGAATDQGDGLYSYDLAGASNNAAGRYTAIFKTAGTADEQHQFSHFISRAVTDALPDGAITAGKIASDAITSAKVADGAITAAKVADGALTAAKFADAFLTAAKIATDAIGSDELAASAVQKILTTAMTESYSTLGGTKTIAQALYEINAMLQEKTVSGTTLTTHRVDGTTTAMTHTLNSSTAPTAITRAS